MEKIIHDLIIDDKEKEYLLTINAKDFVDNLSSKDIIISLLEEYTIISNVSLIWLYTIIFVVVALYFPSSLTDKHKNNKDAIEYITKYFNACEYEQIKIQMTVLTGYMWEESKTKTYKYSIQFSKWYGYENEEFIIMDEITDYSLCMEHINVISFNKNLLFNEWVLNMLLLYNDFVDTLVKYV